MTQRISENDFTEDVLTATHAHTQTHVHMLSQLFLEFPTFKPVCFLASLILQNPVKVIPLYKRNRNVRVKKNRSK